MSRGINAATKSALSSDGFRLATLVQMNLATVTRMTDYGSAITPSGMGTFNPSGHLLDLSDVSETSELRINSTSIRLSGVQQDFVDVFLTGDYMNAQVLIYRAVIGALGTVTGDPFLYFDGRIVGFSIADTENSSEIEVEISSHWKDFEKVNNRKTNSNSQQMYFPDDLGFEFASKMVKDLKWGRK